MLSRNVPPHMKYRTRIVLDQVPQLSERVAVDVQSPFRPSKSGNRFMVPLSIFFRVE